MKNTITKSVMVLASTGVMMNMAYVPVPKHKPSAEAIANYLQGTRLNWEYSEKRRAEILANIRGIRSQIRTQADIMRKDQAATQLLQTIACTMENKTRNRDHQLRSDRARQLHVPAKYIQVDVLRQRKGIPVVDMSDIG